MNISNDWPDAELSIGQKGREFAKMLDAKRRGKSSRRWQRKTNLLVSFTSGGLERRFIWSVRFTYNSAN